MIKVHFSPGRAANFGFSTTLQFDFKGERGEREKKKSKKVLPFYDVYPAASLSLWLILTLDLLVLNAVPGILL